MRRGMLLALLLCAACAAPPRAEAPAQGRLAQAEARAAAQLRSGDTPGAARSYDEALRIATSLEDLDAVAVNAVNLSIVYQWLGRNADARSALAEVIDDPRPFPERRRLQAELRRAIVDLAAGERASAAAMAARAERRCAASCEYAATLLNVNAEILLAGGDASAAARYAAQALERARSRDDAVEAANALRTLGRSARLRGDAAAARTVLEQALELDRKLADPRKILADLTELAHAARVQGDRAAARGYAERAAAVGRGVDGGRSAGEMETGLRRP